MDFKQFYKKINFDIDNEIRTVYQATQGDTKSRGLVVDLIVGGVKTPVTTETMNFFALKPDGTRVMTAGVKEGTGFRIDFTNQTFAVAGVLLCTLVLNGTNGEKIADKKFKMTVDSSLEDGAIISEDERGILDRAFDLASDIVPELEQFNTDIKADELARKIAEEGRATAEEGRVTQLADMTQIIENFVTTPRSEVVIYSKDNLLPPRTAADFEPRSKDIKRFSFPHLWTPYPQEGYPKRSIRDIFDQIFIISSTLDSEINVKFGVTEVVDGTHEIAQSLFEIDLGNISATNGTTVKTMTLTPEKSTEIVSGTTIVKELPELRQPYPAFFLNIHTLTAPTVGEIKIMVCRRFQ